MIEVTENGNENTTYSYDSLDDLTGCKPAKRSYTDSDVYIQFDELTFDGLGRVTSSSQTSDGKTWTFQSYKYNLADELTSITYRPGRVVTTA